MSQFKCFKLFLRYTLFLFYSKACPLDLSIFEIRYFSRSVICCTCDTFVAYVMVTKYSNFLVLLQNFNVCFVIPSFRSGLVQLPTRDHPEK